MTSSHHRALGEHPPPTRPTLGYVPALDGLRALAVMAVMAFHAGLPAARGGFLGVDIFFVLSGFLITALLIGEHAGTGRLNLLAFWTRRARRLLPGLLALLLVVSAGATWLGPAGNQREVHRASWPTLLYVANWVQLGSGQGYFARLAAPSPLMHTWSLAIEEQFYLLWPLVVSAVLWIGRGPAGGLGRRLSWLSPWSGSGQRGRRWPPLFWAAALGAAASAAEMAWLYASGSGLDRAYYGTDTRAQDLLVGAALAAFLFPSASASLPKQSERGPLRRLASALGPRSSGLGTGLSLVGLGAVVVLARGDSPVLYRGGFAAVAGLSACLIATVVSHPQSIGARLLALGPLRYVGRISYGLYLWHWPVYLALDGARTGWHGLALLGLRAGTSLVAAVISFHLIEAPIRRPGTSPWPIRLAWPSVVAGGAGLMLAVTAGAPAVPAALTLASSVGGATRALPDRLPVGVESYLPPVAAGSGGPVRVLVLGDSLAMTLVVGLGSGASSYGVDVQTDAVIGCGLVTQGLVSNRGIVANEGGGIRPGRHWVRCGTWAQRWSNDVARYHPDVVALLAGPWEVRDRLVGGRWTHIGQPAFDRRLRAALGRAVAVTTRRGAHLVLLTCPYMSQPEQPDGRPQPADDPARVAAYNSMLRQTADRAGPRAQMLDLAAVVSPGRRFAAVVHGVVMREEDGIHLTPVAGRWLQPWLLPALVRLAQVGRAH